VIHLGRKNNNKYTYKLGDKNLLISNKERDLGVIVDSSMKFHEQCNTAIKEANKTLGLIRRNIKCKDKDIVVRLYKSLVRPKLEYCVQAWRPHYGKDISGLERVQRRATRMINGYKGLSYEERLVRTGLISLEDRRTRGDLIQVFKLIRGFDKVDYNRFFQLVQSTRTRGHRFKIVKQRSRLDVRKYFFSQRIVNVWNKLPEHVVEADSINSFKNRLDSVWSQVIAK
jgi:ribonuclease P/MRP protein subunit RPP40